MEKRAAVVIDELNQRIQREGEQLGRMLQAGEPFDPDQFALAAGPDSAALLNLLIRVSGARQVVEVGTSIGYTAVWMGEAVRATGGRVIGMEAVAAKHEQAKANVERAGLADVVEIRLGDAKQIVREVSGPIDLAFVDAWKDDYVEYFDVLLPKLRVGGAIVADNIHFPPMFADTMKRFVEHVRARPNVRSHTIPVGSGLEFSVRTA
jgi:predicted O-methyltransferase YrrM